MCLWPPSIPFLSPCCFFLFFLSSCLFYWELVLIKSLELILYVCFQIESAYLQALCGTRSHKFSPADWRISQTYNHFNSQIDPLMSRRRLLYISKYMKLYAAFPCHLGHGLIQRLPTQTCGTSKAKTLERFFTEAFLRVCSSHSGFSPVSSEAQGSKGNR